MGIPVLVMGKSGSGKSASLRNFSPKEVGIFNVASKPLPFKGGKDFMVVNHATYSTIEKTLMKATLKAYVIDDSQYLMAFDSFDNAGVVGFGKFTDMAVRFYQLLKTIIEKTPQDTVVYLLHHSEENEYGDLKAKTIGKMIDQQLTLEGLFSIVLMAKITEDGAYKFITRSNGHNTVKTPLGMFDDELIDNDLKAVDTTIRDYYGFKEDK